MKTTKKTNSLRIKAGDTVEVITGKDSGKRGRVDQVMVDRARVRVDGINIVKRHQKASGNRPGGIMEKPAPIDVSNVMLVCPKCDVPTRVGYRVEGDSKHRVCKKCQKIID